MKARGKQSNQLAGILNYIGKGREMEECTSVPVPAGLLAEQNKTAWLSHNHQANQQKTTIGG
jgi:hypothetical protein